MCFEIVSLLDSELFGKQGTIHKVCHGFLQDIENVFYDNNGKCFNNVEDVNLFFAELANDLNEDNEYQNIKFEELKEISKEEACKDYTFQESDCLKYKHTTRIKSDDREYNALVFTSKDKDYAITLDQLMLSMTDLKDNGDGLDVKTNLNTKGTLECLKVRLSENISKCDEYHFGAPGTELEVVNGFLVKTPKKVWLGNFKNIDELNDYFSTNEGDTVFEEVTEDEKIELKYSYDLDAKIKSDIEKILYKNSFKELEAEVKDLPKNRGILSLITKSDAIQMLLTVDTENTGSIFDHIQNIHDFKNDCNIPVFVSYDKPSTSDLLVLTQDKCLDYVIWKQIGNDNYYFYQHNNSLCKITKQPVKEISKVENTQRKLNNSLPRLDFIDGRFKKTINIGDEISMLIQPNALSKSSPESDYDNLYGYMSADIHIYNANSHLVKTNSFMLKSFPYLQELKECERTSGTFTKVPLYVIESLYEYLKEKYKNRF